MTEETKQTVNIIVALVVFGLLLVIFSLYARAGIGPLGGNATQVRQQKYIVTIPTVAGSTTTADVCEELGLTGGRYEYKIRVNLPPSIRADPSPTESVDVAPVISFKGVAARAKFVGAGEEKETFMLSECINAGCVLSASVFSLVPPLESINPSSDGVKFVEGQEYFTRALAQSSQTGEELKDAVFKIGLRDVEFQGSYFDFFKTCKAKFAVRCEDVLQTTPYLQECKLGEQGEPIVNDECSDTAEMCGGSVTLRIDDLDCTKQTAEDVLIDALCNSVQCREWNVKEQVGVELYDKNCVGEEKDAGMWPVDCALMTTKLVDTDIGVC